MGRMPSPGRLDRTFHSTAAELLARRPGLGDLSFDKRGGAGEI
jgi:hypothetical protein